MITKSQIGNLDEMIDLQKEINVKINKNWIEEKYSWRTAILIECSEMIEHYGWKWWKKQTPDLKQVKLELVDIWHFIISHEISSGGLEEFKTKTYSMVDNFYSNGRKTHTNFITLTESFLSTLLNEDKIDINKFGVLLHLSEMDFNELYVLYIGKNVLNNFRQENGYKEGTYEKVWDGKEDNVVLFSILSSMTGDEKLVMEYIYNKLQDQYDKR